jgi:hypothetical protein
MKGPTKAKNDSKGAYNGKNEEKGAYEGQNEGNKLSKKFCSANIIKVPKAYETLNPVLSTTTYSIVRQVNFNDFLLSTRGVTCRNKEMRFDEGMNEDFDRSRSGWQYAD